MQLRVSSEQFQEAMAMAAAQDRRSRAMMVSFREGLLHFETRYWNHAIPAEREWTESVVVQMGWARKLNRKPFDADPLTLKVERGQLFAETFSTPCKLMSTMDPFDPMLDDPKDEERIRRAARLLGRMLVNLEDIRDSVQQARDRMHEPWHDNKLKTLKLVAEAWVVLSPGFVKEPAVGTRENFSAADYSDEELEKAKREDGVRMHAETKVQLETYALQQGVRAVKPFMLVIARNTEHAEDLRKRIESAEFFGGQYAGKTIMVHSNQTGERTRRWKSCFPWKTRRTRLRLWCT